MIQSSELKGSIGNRVQEKVGYRDHTDEGKSFKGCMKIPVGNVREEFEFPVVQNRRLQIGTLNYIYSLLLWAG